MNQRRRTIYGCAAREAKNSICHCGNPLFLTIPPPTYILVGFLDLPFEPLGGEEAHSLTYDQGPALLSRSLF